MNKQKKVSIEEAIGKIKSGDVININATCAFPNALISALIEHIEQNNIRDLTIHSFLIFEPGGISDTDFLKKHNINMVCWFVGPAQRSGIRDGSITFMPNHFKECPKFMAEQKTNVFMSDVSPMDEEGYFNFGTGVSYAKAVAQKADLVIFQTNEYQPRVFGDEAKIHISDVDYFVEANHDLITLPISEMSEEDKRIGQYVADLIEDGSTLQIGIGGMPSAVALNLMDKKDMGIHTEMIADCMADLYEAGVITGYKKTIDRGKIVGSFVLGSKKIYDFIDLNPAVECRSIAYTNDPAIIAKNEKQIAINAALEVDLTGQVCSESIGPLQYSGTGGQLDFTRGAYASPGGKAFICLNSTAKKGMVSKVVPMLKRGAIVTTPRTEVHYLVTEYGVAMLKGKSVAQRARAIIGLAAPEFRESLLKDARDLALI